MVAKVITTVSKKIPIEGLDFSSVSASCTVEAEIADLAAVPAQARALYVQAEAAVDQQLRLTPQGLSIASAAPTTPNSVPPPAATRPSSPPPYRSGGQRRGPAPITDAQLRFLDRLIKDTGTDPNGIIQQHQIGSLRELTAAAASGLIDSLRGQGAAR